MNEQNIRNICKMLMKDTELVYVSTVDEKGFPQTRAMNNLRNIRRFGHLAVFFNQQENDFIVYLVTKKTSGKIDRIGKNPRVCLYYCSFSEGHGVALTGNIEVIEDVEIRKTLWHEDWVRNFKGGLNDPNYTVLMVKPFHARGFYKMEKYEFAIT